MYSNNTFDFAALHKIINMIVRSLGRNTIWLGKHENVLEQICSEFEDEDDNEKDI